MFLVIDFIDDEEDWFFNAPEFPRENGTSFFGFTAGLNF